MKTVIQALTFLALSGGGFGAMAAGPARTPVVLELFTSEGCSSCPPADRLLQALNDKQPFAGVELIVLSEHVDYWNRLGWSDPFSSKAFSNRQRQYGEQLGLDSVYTPQLVVDGEYELVGSNAAQAKAAIEKAAQSQKAPLMLSGIVRDGNHVNFHASLPGLAGANGNATLYLALAECNVRSEVRNGENAGRSLSHVDVVRSLTAVATIKNESQFSKDFSIDLPSGLGPSKLVAFLQSNQSHRILGAAAANMTR